MERLDDSNAKELQQQEEGGAAESQAERVSKETLPVEQHAANLTQPQRKQQQQQPDM